ncbi:DEAD/DEAH box helicase [Hungatella sp.]|jgi:DEAD/DEAH box helicase domain-containing protein|uniref:DEAD/DEAH box helicase n=1 Tax=Hungatella sp. TaxID=2613924 RepID=UPI002A7FABA7|nr:DEAD/DEAH box helicase [Hungatella sp.]
MDINDLIIYRRTMPERSARYAGFPAELPEELREYLQKNGVRGLYIHQAEMFLRSLKRENVVITTSTASGKTLGFLLPVIEEILRNPLARAVFIYPTKALASDQYRAIQPFIEYFGKSRISAGVYDGDTPAGERSRIRKEANIILTNPEMVNGAFLPNHSKFGFDFIFTNLKFVVIDELHTYRGVFGSHLANVFRRLHRVCRYYGSSPVFLCSSATIANPVELAEEICGRKFVRIERDGSPAAERTYLLIKPPKIQGHDKKYYGQVQATAVAAELIPELVEQRKNFIAFARSRRNVEVILKEARDRLEAESPASASQADKISGYRGGYTPAERKEIEHKMVTGALCGLVSTNALELGIDIGKIDATVLAGYPGTRASFWQQTGRAGRSGRACTNYLILDSQPFDQYIGTNPGWLFENSSESAVVDKNNLLIELSHIRAAAAEIPLTLDDASVFPDLGETIPVLMRAKELTGQNGKFVWSGGSFPAGDYSLRNIDPNRYKLLLKDSGKEITEMDEMQAFREIHPGAVYLHGGVQYQVVTLDLETRTARAVPFNGNYYTTPMGNTDITIIHGRKEKPWKRIDAVFGDVNVNAQVSLYRKLQFHNHQNLGYEQINPSLSREFETESVWLKLPGNVVTAYRRLLQESPNGQMIRNNHFEGLCCAIRNAARLVTMTEQEDIGTTVSTNAVYAEKSVEESVYLFLYDQYTGGLGYAEKAYELIPEIIENGIAMVSGCPCEDGCAACVGDYHLDKSMVLWGLRNMLEESEVPKHVKMAPYGPSTFIQKPFRFDELEAQWKAFTAMLLKNGEPFASFLNTVNAVRTEGRRLALITDQPFYREWIMEETNRKALNNLISYYTDAPKGFELEVEVRKREENRENRDDGCGENGGDRSGDNRSRDNSGDNSDMRKKLEQRLNKLKKKED